MNMILVVDDDEQNLNLLEMVLKNSGYEVNLAKHGTEALESARKRSPDLVISDILMPIMDGFTLCRHWKADEKLKAIPFIFYTSTYTDTKDYELALKLGADRFITKPEAPEKLLKIIEEVIEESRAGKHKVPEKPIEEGKVYYKQYSEVLINKLEKKMLQLEKAMAELEISKEVLRKSEERFRTIFEKNEAFMLLIEPVSGRILNANISAQRFYGYPAEALKGMNIQDVNVSPPNKAKEPSPRFKKVNPNYSVSSHRLASGEIRTVEVYTTPIVVGISSILYLIIHDITDGVVHLSR